MISRIIIELESHFRFPTRIIGDNPNDASVEAIEYSASNGNSFEYRVDPANANIITMLAAYLRPNTGAAVFYTFNSYTDTPVLYAETESSSTSGGILSPHEWMPEQNYFLANKPPTALQATSSETGPIWLQRISATRPPNPPATAIYTGQGVTGWGDDLSILGDWSTPASTLVSPDGHPTWVARASVGINADGNRVQTPWLIGAAIADETIQHGDHDDGPWSFVDNNNPAGFFRLRTSNGDWTAGIPKSPFSNARAILGGTVQVQYNGQLIPPLRLVVPTPFNIRNISDVGISFMNSGDLARLNAGTGSHYPVPWTEARNMRVAPYSTNVLTSVLYEDVTSVVHISSPWGARWGIGLSAQVGATGGVNQSINLTWMAAENGDPDVVAYAELPYAGNPVHGSLTIRTR